MKGVTILQMGGQPEAVAGLVRGSVDGAVFSPPYNFQLKKQGYNELVSPNELQKFTAFITNGIVARRSVVEKDKDSLIRLIKSTSESIKLITVDREFTKKVITKWMPLERPGLVGTGLSLCDGKLCQRGCCARGRSKLYGQADGAKQYHRCEIGCQHAVDRLLRQPLRRRGESAPVS